MLENQNTLLNKTALIIGGTYGLGLCLSALLAQKGCNLILTGYTKEHIQKAKKKLGDFAVSLEVIKQDFSFENATNIDFRMLKTKIKKADILCISFGPYLKKTLKDTTISDWQNIIFCNLTLPGILISSALECWGGECVEKKKSQQKSILLFGVAGVQSIKGFATCPAYAAAKTALCSLTKSVAKDSAKSGVVCNAILPGFVEEAKDTYDTYTKEANTKEASTKDNNIKETKDRPTVLANSVAKAALFLLETKDINGQLLCVDSGFSA